MAFLSPDEREWIRQQALKQYMEYMDAEARATRPDIVWGINTVYGQSVRPSELVLQHDRQFLAQLKIQADF